MKLAPGGRSRIRQIFEITIPLETMVISVNDHNIGGKDNSITPRAVPWLSPEIWCADFSAAPVSDEDRSTFIHECAHAWQYYHPATKAPALRLVTPPPARSDLPYPCAWGVRSH